MFINFFSTFELWYQSQSWIAAVEIIWPAKPKIITHKDEAETSHLSTTASPFHLS